MAPAGGKATADDEELAGHEAGGAGGQIHHGADELLDAAKPPHWRTREELLAPGPFEDLAVQIRLEHAGRDGVDREAVRRPLDPERSCQPADPRLAPGVSGAFMQAPER